MAVNENTGCKALAHCCISYSLDTGNDFLNEVLPSAFLEFLTHSILALLCIKQDEKKISFEFILLMNGTGKCVFVM